MKKFTPYVVASIAFALAITGAGIAWTGNAEAAADKSAAPAIGSAMPDFKMKDQDGNEHMLAMHKGQIVVLEFSSQHCPFSKGTDPHIAELATQYKDKNVVVLGVDSHKSTKPEDIKEHVAAAKIPFPVLKDEKNQYADQVGATKTPEIYIVDKEGKLAYHGAFDSRKGPEQKGEENYVAAALDALIAGAKVAQTEVPAWGCGIQRAS